LGRKRKFGECKRNSQRIREGISTRYGKCSAARAQRRDVPMERTARKIYSKKAIWMVRQEIRPRILGKIGKELEAMEGQETGEKRNNGNDSRGRRNQERKFRDTRMDRGRQ